MLVGGFDRNYVQNRIIFFLYKIVFEFWSIVFSKICNIYGDFWYYEINY